MIAVSITVQSTGSNANTIDSTNASFSSLGDAGLLRQLVGSRRISDGADSASRTRSPSIASIPGVAEVVPGQMAYATLGDKRVLIQGLAPGVGRAAVARNERAKCSQQVLAGDGVVVSRDIARALGIQAGDELTLPTPTGARQRSRAGGGAVLLIARRCGFDEPDRNSASGSTGPGRRFSPSTSCQERTVPQLRRRSAKDCRPTSSCTRAMRRRRRSARPWLRARHSSTSWRGSSSSSPA